MNPYAACEAIARDAAGPGEPPDYANVDGRAGQAAASLARAWELLFAKAGPELAEINRGAWRKLPHTEGADE